MESWAGDERIGVHPRAQRPGQRRILPGQWEGLPRGDNRPRREAMAVQTPVGKVGASLCGSVRVGVGRCPMIALEQARQHLESLGLKQAVEVLDNTLDVSASKQLTYPEMLEQLLGAEVEARRERKPAGSDTCPPDHDGPIPLPAHLEAIRLLLQPSIEERQSLPS